MVGLVLVVISLNPSPTVPKDSEADLTGWDSGSTPTQVDGLIFPRISLAVDLLAGEVPL